MTAGLRSLLPFGGALLVLAGGAALVCPGGSCGVPGFDAIVLAQADDWRSPAADALARGITWLGSLFVLAPLVLWLAWRDARHQGWATAGFVPAALLLASALAHLAKLAVLRPRPDLFPTLAAMPTDASYPSAHAMQATAVALALLLRPGKPSAWPAWLAGAALVIAVGISRIHLQVHFPSDVLAGSAAAVLLVLALRSLPPWRVVRS